MASSKGSKGRVDVFAQIAAARDALRGECLVEPRPPVLPDITLPSGESDPGAAFRPAPKIDTLAKLKRELARQRRAHARFLSNCAPEIEPTRTRLVIGELDWRVQTPDDLADFAGTLRGSGNWERVRIPHYNAPLGRAVTYYRTEFALDDAFLARGAIFLCLKGVDYIARAFVNGSYVGSHEGFFAPFEFDITPVARAGDNVLLVKVENDAIFMGNDSWGDDGALYEGDKLYAATGPGYDEPTVGWHHCPPGMGIYHDVYIEARSPIHIHDVFVRPIIKEHRAEAWVEVNSTRLTRHDVALELSVHGRNFRRTVLKARRYDLPGPVGPTLNYFRLPFDIPKARMWDLDSPWLYQAQVRLLDSDGNTLDAQSRQFGMRSFEMDEQSEPKGRLSLNGREIRLRGANTMGFEQQDVMKGDWAQLVDDILLAKICNMNFLRLTQRPVQPEVYDYCDRLGLMTQTDLPLFGMLRTNKFCEAVRQSEEMERLVRAHPCNVVVSYINEPMPHKWNARPYRHLTRPELESFFVAADQAVRLANPDRVIKPVDGDYDPPGPGLPDNHCYNGWYNGHGLDLGKLHAGHWQKAKPNWFYGCGEFGAEGLDPVELMKRRYPSEWLPQSPEEEREWSPDRIVKAQTGRFHYMWFDTQHSVRDWVRASQDHQAWIIRLMTEAFRRDSRMNTFAIHLFIDAFPSGWMKTIMDCERNPKPAYFAYREALAPLMAHIRTDRWGFLSGEQIELEAWICNDIADAPRGLFLHYQFEMNGEVVWAQRSPASVPVCSSAFQGHIRVCAPEVDRRTQALVRIGLVGRDGSVIHDSATKLDIFPHPAPLPRTRVCCIGAADGRAARLCRELGLERLPRERVADAGAIVVDDYSTFRRTERVILRRVSRRATLVLIELPAGSYDIAGDRVDISECGMGARHFVSRATGHRLVSGFEPGDFRFWYDAEARMVTPLLGTTVSAPGWNPILASGNGDWTGDWGPALAAAEKRYGDGVIRLCQMALAGRVEHNPPARILARRLLQG